MKRAPRSRQRHDLYAKYHDYDSEISDLLGECGIKSAADSGQGMMALEISVQLARARFDGIFGRIRDFGQELGVPQYSAEVTLRS